MRRSRRHCAAKPARDRGWLTKVRPYWGHDYHFHVRLACPADSADCKPQPSPLPGDGCGKELDWWFTDAVLHPKPAPAEAPPSAAPMAGLPPACRAVLTAPERPTSAAARLSDPAGDPLSGR